MKRRDFLQAAASSLMFPAAMAAMTATRVSGVTFEHPGETWFNRLNRDINSNRKMDWHLLSIDFTAEQAEQVHAWLNTLSSHPLSFEERKRHKMFGVPVNFDAQQYGTLWLPPGPPVTHRKGPNDQV